MQVCLADPLGFSKAERHFQTEVLLPMSRGLGWT